MRTMATALLAMGLAGCGRAPEGYPPSYERNFMQACQAQGSATSVCGCIWARIEAETPRTEFDALERLPPARRALDPAQLRIEGYARACAG